MRIRSLFLIITIAVITGGGYCAAPVYAEGPQQSEMHMTDLQITDAIEDEYLFDDAVSGNQIDVSVYDGVATLSGKVPHILAKDRAEKIAEVVKGVRSVVNRIHVKPNPDRSDTDIQRDVSETLMANSATSSYEIIPTVKNGKVTLKGKVDNWQQKQLAEKIVKGVKGVTEVDSRNYVDYGADISDAEIEGILKTSLRWDILINDTQMTAKVKDGEAVIAGMVGSAAEKTRVVSKAWMAGAKSVKVSDLMVKSWAEDQNLRESKYAPKPDDEIKKAVEDALFYDPRVSSFAVDVASENGIVTLRGSVTDLKGKRAASEDARNTVGVWQIHNRIKVKPLNEVIDGVVEKNVKDAFMRDPYVESFEIQVRVKNGIAYLTGTVDSFFEKIRADEIASGIIGVSGIKNYINVSDTLAYIYDPYVEGGFVRPYGSYAYGHKLPYYIKPDSRIKSDIQNQLWWSPFIDSDDVMVSVENGVATLQGEVASWSEYHTASKNAFDGGAIWVNNELSVYRNPI